MRLSRPAVLGALGLLAAPGLAQLPPLQFPAASPKASVTQRVGLTDVTVRYSRPAVNGRKVWGGLVPYGEVWRTGADENTTLSFSSAVTVGGKTLPAGTYGLHTIPGETEWTVILSSEAGAWGSFSYDAKEDAVRFTAVPKEGPPEERLLFTLDDPTNESVAVTMTWDRLRLSFPVGVDTKGVVLASLKEQLRGLPRFGWQGWNAAAAWCLRNDVALDQAEEWVDRSVKMNPNFTNQATKANLLEKKGDAKAAAELREKALALATEAEVNAYGYQLLGQKKTAEALRMFEKNAKDHPGSWNVWDSLAEGLATAGEKKKAIAGYEKALSMVDDADQKKRITGEIAKLKQ